MSVNRCEHCNRHQGVDSTASFINLKVKRVVSRIHYCADRVDADADQIANSTRNSGLKKLQPDRGLGEEIQRHHEKEECNWKQHNSTRRYSPHIQNYSKENEWKCCECEPSLHSSRADQKQQ